jgi:hypothetical protein
MKRAFALRLLRVTVASFFLSYFSLANPAPEGHRHLSYSTYTGRVQTDLETVAYLRVSSAFFLA